MKGRKEGKVCSSCSVSFLKRCFYGECFGFRFWIPCPFQHDDFGDLLAVWLTSTFTDKNGEAQSEPPPPPTPKTGAVQYSNQQRVGSHCVRANSKVLWVEVFFFQIIFVLMYFDLYMTYIYLFIYNYIYDYIYTYIYNYIYISPSFGLWEIFMHSLQRRLWSYALRTFITIRMCQLKCSTGNNDSWKAL